MVGFKSGSKKVMRWPPASSTILAMTLALSLVTPPMPVNAQAPIYIAPTAPLTDNNYGCSIMDDSNYAYFGTMTKPGKIVKIDMKTLALTPTLVGTLTLNAGEGKS